MAQRFNSKGFLLRLLFAVLSVITRVVIAIIIGPMTLCLVTLV